MKFIINNADFCLPGSEDLKEELDHIADLTGLVVELEKYKDVRGHEDYRYVIYLDDLDDLLKAIYAIKTSFVVSHELSFDGIPYITIYDGYLE